MNNFTCGCTADGTRSCRTHTHWPCHDDFGCAENHDVNVTAICPPCWLARLRSVNLDSSATPTRGGGK